MVYHWVLSFIHILNILVPMWNCLDQLTSCMYTCNKGEERAMALHSPHPHSQNIAKCLWDLITNISINAGASIRPLPAQTLTTN